MESAELQTPRLVLRPLRSEDACAFAAMNADPRVMAHFAAALTRAESDALLERLREHHAARGFGLWALEAPWTTPFAGFVGLSTVHFDAPFPSAAAPCVELGWRLARAFWGQGYAREGARASITFAFETLGLSELVAFTTPENARSIAVMRALGMHHDALGDFDHPRVPEGHRLRRHVLYRLARGAAPEVGDALDLALARRFAAALDADDFERARPLLSPECVYEVRGSVLVGRDAILRSYADATRHARRTFEAVRYESEVEATPGGARVHFTDVLTRGAEEHRHRSTQHLTLGAGGLITRIVHEDLPGERARLAVFLG